MRLYTFDAQGKTRIGVEAGDGLIDLAADSTFPQDMIGLLRAGDVALSAARRLVESGSAPHYPFDAVRILAPIPRPGKILCSGLNYRSHLDENPDAVLPESPFFFAKLPNTVIGPGEAIILPEQSQQVDYEVEFAVVIGKPAPRGTSLGHIMSCVFGYTLLHDVSARDVQFRDNQITLGKNFDTFAPIGPCIVTKEEIADLDNVKLRSYINDQMMQDGSTSDWVFPLPRLLTAVTDVMSLEPGDIISTGTPGGVGYFRQPQVFLKSGDVVVIEAEGIGKLENPVLAASS